MSGEHARAHGLNVYVGDDQHLHVEGSDLVIENPLLGKGLDLNLGLLWLYLWSTDQHNNPNPSRVRSMLLNAASASVSKIMQILGRTEL